MLNLDDWRPGVRLCLVDYGCIDQVFRSRLLAMGMTRGVIIQIIRVAPFGNPIQINLRGVMLALRKEELQALHWKKL